MFLNKKKVVYYVKTYCCGAINCERSWCKTQAVTDGVLPLMLPQLLPLMLQNRQRQKLNGGPRRGSGKWVIHMWNIHL